MRLSSWRTRSRSGFSERDFARGSIGDVVKVRRGYARNYLLPRGLAVVASRGNVKQVEHEKAVQAQRIATLRSTV